MKPYYIIYILLFILLLGLTSCSKDDPGPSQPQYVMVAEAATTNNSFNVQFFAKDSLFVGYNRVFFRINEKSSGNLMSQAEIKLNPVMDMGTFKHSCPYENPSAAPDANGYFNGAVMFSMAGSTNGWSLSLNVTANGMTDSVFFPISKVVVTNPVKKIVVIDSLDNGSGGWIITKYPVSIVEPETWGVGNNQFEITVNKMASMFSFPVVNDMTIEIIPEMPSMGHGSPNNVNPVLTTDGHYAGTVNFTMTGSWRVHMNFTREGRAIGKNAWFDINF